MSYRYVHFYSSLIHVPLIQKSNHRHPTNVILKTALPNDLLPGVPRVQSPFDHCIPFEQTITISTAQNMANGKDFFLELRKQIASLQRSGPPVGG